MEKVLHDHLAQDAQQPHLVAHLGGRMDDDILERQHRGRKWASGETCLALPFCRSSQPWSPGGSDNGTTGRGAGAWWPPEQGLETQGSALTPHPLVLAQA